MDIVEISVWAGAVVIVATCVWAAIDHIRDEGHVLTAPLLIVWAVLGATMFGTILVFFALFIVGGLVSVTLPTWFPLDLGS